MTSPSKSHLEKAREIAYKFLDESAGRDRCAKAFASALEAERNKTIEEAIKAVEDAECIERNRDACTRCTIQKIRNLSSPQVG